MKQKRDRYEMHKYWGKKPSGDLKQLIEKYTTEGDTVFDPFSGYGVFCCEAFLLNRNVISNDLNPIANFLNRQLLELDVDIPKVKAEWKIIRNEFIRFSAKWFSWTYDGESVQLITVLRDKNDIPLKARIKPIGSKNTIEIDLDEDQVATFMEFEKNYVIDDWFPTNPLIENSRISAKKNMTVADLFTKRTLACHARLLALIEKHSNGKERELIKVAFTANLANCSKLVPPIKSRGAMSAGAWMTGFYTGETYLENNVLNFFENRFSKLIKGKSDYLSFFANTSDQFVFFEHNNDYKILQEDAKKLSLPSDSVDYIFTDPPYGDAVPYFEQSIIWNSWLKLSPDYENEIVVSDSRTRNKNLDSYEKEIFEAFEEIRRVLKPGGYFSLTYHSLSGAEWRSITNACIRNGFVMTDFSWLVQKSFTPRQINRLKSIKGDVLVTFQKAPSITTLSKSDEDLKNYFIGKIESWLQVEPLDTNEIFLRIMKMIFSEKIIVGDIDVFETLNEHFVFTENQTWKLKTKLKRA